MVNGNPSKSPQKTFIVMGFESVELTVPLVPGKQYLAYTRISKWVKDTAYCDAMVSDPETSKIILQCTDLRYQKLPRVTWKHVLEKSHGTSSAPTHRAPVKETKKTVEVSRQTLDIEKVQPQATEAQEDGYDDDDEYSQDEGLIDAISDSNSKATGSDSSEFTDDTMVADLGVDFIMAIEVVATVKEESGLDLPATLVLDHPTIGDLRRAFGGADKPKAPKSKAILTPSSSQASIPSSPSPESISMSETASSLGSSAVDIEKDDLITPLPEGQDNNTKQQGKPLINKVIDPDTSPAPSVRITLLQGRPGPKRTPLYMMADGTGTIATYIHLPSSHIGETLKRRKHKE
jgi:acyl carrier protein